MIYEIVIPDLGATGGEVTFEEWLVKPNEFVTAGQPLFVITTDKATVEVEAYNNGFIRKLVTSPGTQLEIGHVVALMSDSLEEPVDDIPKEGIDAKESLSLGSKSREGGDEIIVTKDRILASPLAKRMAKEAGIDISQIHGTGKQGQVTKRDIEAHIRENKTTISSRLSPALPRIEKHLPISTMRKSISQRTQESKSEIPHFYGTITIDMDTAMAFLESAVKYANKRGWQQPTITDLALRATSLALQQTPQINVSIREEEIVYYQDINIGIVVSLEDGIIIPVLHQVDQKNLYTIAALTQQLKAKSRSRTLSSSELTGSTFTLSNLGMYGLDSFTAVINPPEAGVLALGAVQRLPAVRDERIIPVWQMTCVLSVDHRLVDGTVAAKFLSKLKYLLENPARLAVEAPEEVEL